MRGLSRDADPGSIERPGPRRHTTRGLRAGTRNPRGSGKYPPAIACQVTLGHNSGHDVPHSRRRGARADAPGGGRRRGGATRAPRNRAGPHRRPRRRGPRERDLREEQGDRREARPDSRDARSVSPRLSRRPDLLATIDALNRDDAVDGILVQLPLPKHVATARVLEAIDPRKDADGFHPENAGPPPAGQAGARPVHAGRHPRAAQARGASRSAARAPSSSAAATSSASPWRSSSSGATRP